MAASEAIRLDYQDLDAISHEAPGQTFSASLSLDPDAAPQGDFHDDIPVMTVSQAFDPFSAHAPKDDPEVSVAFKRLDLVEARLARIEKRLMEISLLIARNFNATLETPIGVPDALDPTASGDEGLSSALSAGPSSIVQAPSIPRQTRGKRDLDLDDALEAFLNSLGAPPTQTRQ